MECYQELLLNIIEFMLDYINSNILQTMYYDLYDEIYEETNELFYPHLIETDLLTSLFNLCFFSRWKNLELKIVTLCFFLVKKLAKFMHRIGLYCFLSK